MHKNAMRKLRLENGLSVVNRKLIVHNKSRLQRNSILSNLIRKKWLRLELMSIEMRNRLSKSNLKPISTLLCRGRIRLVLLIYSPIKK